jgi:putative ABC transport system permease protein
VWSRKGRTFMVSIAIFVGVLGVVTLLSSSDLLIRQLNEDLKQDELAMVRAAVGVPSGVELDNAALLEKLRGLPGVTAVQGSANYPIRWKLPSDEKFRDGYVRAFSEPFGEVPLEPMRLTTQGRYPNPGHKEIAIERRMAKKYKLQVGDELVLCTLGDTTIQEESWTIVGVVYHAYTYFNDAGFLPNDVSVYANYEDAQHIAGFTGFSSIYARYTDFPRAERESAHFLATITENSPYAVVYNFTGDPAKNPLLTISQQYVNVISILAVVAMVVSGFLVANVISTIVLEQNRQIGVMKSLGATRWDNFVMYAGIAFTYGLIGLVPGVLLGIPVGYWLATVIAEFSNTLIEEFAISPLGVGAGVGMGLLVPVLTAMIPVFNGTRVTVLEAVTDLGISTGYGGGRTARLIGALPLPANMRQALSNIVQKRGRLALTMATLTLAVGAFMGVFAVFFSLNEVINGIFDAFGYEIQVSPTDIQDFEQVQELILENVEGVVAVYPAVGLALQVEGYTDSHLDINQLDVIGLDPTTDAFALDLKEGMAWQDDPRREGIVLSSGVAEQLGKKVGQTLVVTAGGKGTELEIIGIDHFPHDQAFMEWHALARLAGLEAGAPRPNQYTALVQVDDYTGSLPGGQAVAVGFDEQAGAFLPIESGASLVAGEPGVIISTDMAARGGYQVGDKLNLNVGDNTQAYPIVGVFSPLPHKAAEGGPTDVVGMHWKDLAALEGRKLAGEPAPNALLVRLANPEATVAQVDEASEAISEALVEQGITATFINQVAVAEEESESVLTMGMVFNVTSAVMAAVGAIGLLTTLSMSVFERQKEIGVMRSIGAGSLTVAGQFLVEGLLVGLIAWIVGVPLSYFLGQGLMSALPFGFVEFNYPLVSLALGLMGMLLIAAVSSLWPSIGAARKTVSEIIRYQ